MAGSDQSANLGGMLSQIGGVLGKGVDVSGLGANIVNMSRPDVDPTNLQQKFGREDAARTTMAGVQQLQAQQLQAKKEQAALAKEAKAAGAVQVVGQYARLLQDPNATPEQIDAAFAAAADYGDANGLDTYTKLAQIDQQAAARSDQAWQEQDRAETAQEEAALVRFNAQLSKAETPDEVDAALADVPPNVRPTAQQLAVSQQRYTQMRADSVEEAAVQNTPINLAPIQSAQSTLASKSPELAATFAPRIAALEATEKTGFVNGVWVTPASQKSAEKQYNALLNDMAAQEASLIVDDRRAERDEEKAYQRAVNSISTSKPNKQETPLIAEEIESEKPENNDGIPFNTPKATQAEIYARYREGQLESLNAQYNKAPAVTDFASEVEVEAANLPAGTKITVNGRPAITE